jgi:hypothetical protein
MRCNWGYCVKARIKMARSRPYKKNDNVWMEQKNWTHVRKPVPTGDSTRRRSWRWIRELYGYDRLYKNFFQQAMKLGGQGADYDGIDKGSNPRPIRRGFDNLPIECTASNTISLVRVTVLPER